MNFKLLIFKKIIPILILVLIIIPISYTIYLFFFIKPQITLLENELSEVSKQNITKSEIKYNLFENTEQYKILEKKLNELEKDIIKILPFDDESGKVADEIQKNALECNVEIVNINIYNTTINLSPNIFALQIKLDCNSTYKSFKKFLWYLTYCSQSMLIDKLEINSQLFDEKINYTYYLTLYVKK